MDSLIGLGISDDDIVTDKAPGGKTEPPGLGACLATLQPGDTLVVWRLDRLGRSMHRLVGLIAELRD
ncbi:DNA-invertase hin [Lacipirellula limnantheis]|uniref:DNA-invertase hin n=1 Tax=Lacipirellula limnantheis TaxID=2528024 RepID=A0A517TY18_9BACT|nr:DNA-invertase hin [Lacipirellula limnantheis]